MKSSIQLCAERILAASTTQIVNNQWLRQGNEIAVSKAMASTAIWEFKKNGILIPITNNIFKYTIDRPTAVNYFKTRVFSGANSIALARRTLEAGAKKKITQEINKMEEEAENYAQQPSTPTDIDIIDTLLDAMALAAPVLQKYKKICEAVHE